jgi:transposase
MSEANKQKQPKFALEFKQDAAGLVIEKGVTHPQAAASLGV